MKNPHSLVFFYLLPLVLAGFMNQKFTVDIESAFVCPDNNELEVPIRKYQVDRINRTHRAFTVDFTLPRPVDKNSECSIILERWADGKWINMPFFPYQKDPCQKVLDSNFEWGKELFFNFMKALGVKNPHKCPIPAGNYSVNRYPISLEAEIPFWSGRLKSSLILRRVDTKKKFFCAGSIINNVAKT